MPESSSMATDFEVVQSCCFCSSDMDHYAFQIFKHPILSCLAVCKPCHEKAVKVQCSSKRLPNEAMDRCSVCFRRDQGDLTLCGDDNSTCRHVFCSECIIRLRGESYLDSLKHVDVWICFVCDKKELIKLWKPHFDRLVDASIYNDSDKEDKNLNKILEDSGLLINFDSDVTRNNSSGTIGNDDTTNEDSLSNCASVSISKSYFMIEKGDSDSNEDLTFSGDEVRAIKRLRILGIESSKINDFLAPSNLESLKSNIMLDFQDASVDCLDMILINKEVRIELDIYEKKWQKHLDIINSQIEELFEFCDTRGFGSIEQLLPEFNYLIDQTTGDIVITGEGDALETDQSPPLIPKINRSDTSNIEPSADFDVSPSTWNDIDQLSDDSDSGNMCDFPPDLSDDDDFDKGRENSGHGDDKQMSIEEEDDDTIVQKYSHRPDLHAKLYPRTFENITNKYVLKALYYSFADGNDDDLIYLQKTFNIPKKICLVFQYLTEKPIDIDRNGKENSIKNWSLYSKVHYSILHALYFTENLSEQQFLISEFGLDNLEEDNDLGICEINAEDTKLSRPGITKTKIRECLRDENKLLQDASLKLRVFSDNEDKKLVKTKKSKVKNMPNRPLLEASPDRAYGQSLDEYPHDIETSIDYDDNEVSKKSIKPEIIDLSKHFDDISDYEEDDDEIALVYWKKGASIDDILSSDSEFADSDSYNDDYIDRNVYKRPINDPYDIEQLIKSNHNTYDSTIGKKSELKISNESKKVLYAERKKWEIINGFKIQPSVRDVSDNAFVLNLKRPENEDIITANAYMSSFLKEHQKEACTFLWKSVITSLQYTRDNPLGSGCILAHCMGLGKTLAVLTFVVTLLTDEVMQKGLTIQRRFLSPNGGDSQSLDPTVLSTWDEMTIETPMFHSILVIAPLNVIQNWSSECERWIPRSSGISVYLVDSSFPVKERLQRVENWYKGGGILITNYDCYVGLVKHENEQIQKPAIFYLQNPGPDIVIADEAHTIKNSNTKINDIVCKIRTKRRIGLTGSPLQNNLKEYWVMVNWVYNRFLGTYSEFKSRYIDPIKAGEDKDATSAAKKKMKRRVWILYNQLSQIVHRKDSTILAEELPSKREFAVFINLHPCQEFLYKYYLKLLVEQSDSIHMLTTCHSLLRICNHPATLALYCKGTDKMKRESTMDTLGLEMHQFINNFSKEESSNQLSMSLDSINEHLFERLSQPMDEVPGSDSMITNENNVVTHSSSSAAISSLVQFGKRKREGEGGGGGGGGVETDLLEDDEDEVECAETLSIDKHWWKIDCGRSDKMVDDFIIKDFINISHKMTVLLSLLVEAGRENSKMVVFSQSLLTLDVIEKVLSMNQWSIYSSASHEPDDAKIFSNWKLNSDYVRIDGKNNERMKIINKFNSENKVKLCLISTKAGNMGINLQAGNRVVIFDCSWNPAHDLQAIHRCFRIGQKKNVFIYRFIAKGTMEEKVYRKQIQKLALSDRVIDSKMPDNAFTSDEISDVLRFVEEKKSSREDSLMNELESGTIDNVFLKALKGMKGMIFSVDSHDSYLEDKPDEHLNESEHAEALIELEDENNGKQGRQNLKKQHSPESIAKQIEHKRTSPRKLQRIVFTVPLDVPQGIVVKTIFNGNNFEFALPDFLKPGSVVFLFVPYSTNKRSLSGDIRTATIQIPLGNKDPILNFTFEGVDYRFNRRDLVDGQQIQLNIFCPKVNPPKRN